MTGNLCQTSPKLRFSPAIEFISVSQDVFPAFTGMPMDRVKYKNPHWSACGQQQISYKYPILRETNYTLILCGCINKFTCIRTASPPFYAAQDFTENQNVVKGHDGGACADKLVYENYLRRFNEARIMDFSLLMMHANMFCKMMKKSITKH